MFDGGFRDSLQSRSLAHVQRLATQLDDIRNLEPSSRSSSLHEATKHGRNDLFSWLLLEQQHEAREITQDARGETILHLAAERGFVDIISLYLEFYPQVLPRSTPTLHRPRTVYPHCISQRLCNLSSPQFRTTTDFAKSSFVIDWVNAFGATPLHLAAMKGSAEAAALLIEQGADIDAPDSNGDTPLHLYHLPSSLEIPSLITMIDSASSWGQLDVIKLLIASNATSNAQNNHGFTPNAYAYSYSILESLESLIKAQRRTKKKASRIASTTSTSSTLSSRKPSFATTLHPISIPYPVSGWNAPSGGTSIINAEDDSITPSTSPNTQANDFRFADSNDKANPSSYLLARSNSLAVPDHSSNYSESIPSSSPYLGQNDGAISVEQFATSTSPLLLPSPIPSPSDLPPASPSTQVPPIASPSSVATESTTAHSVRTDSFDSVKPSRRALLALEQDASQSRSYNADPTEGGRNRSQSNSTFGTITSSENDSSMDGIEDQGPGGVLDAGRIAGLSRGNSAFLGGSISNRGNIFANTIGKSINRARSSSHLSVNSSAPSFPPTVQHFQSSNATNTQTNVVSPLAANADGSPINPATAAVARSKSHTGGRRSRASSTSISIVPLLLPPSNNPITPPLPTSPTPSTTAQAQAQSESQARLIPPTAIPLPLSPTSPTFPPPMTNILLTPSLLPPSHPASKALSRNSSSNSVLSSGTSTPGRIDSSGESSRAGSITESKVLGEIRRGSEGLGRFRGIFGRKKEKE